MPEKPKLAVYWAASCGGCEIAIANLHEKLLDVDAALDFMFCPCLMDTKTKDIEALPDRAISVTLFNGALRTQKKSRGVKSPKFKFEIWRPLWMFLEKSVAARRHA